MWYLYDFVKVRSRFSNCLLLAGMRVVSVGVSIVWSIGVCQR